MIDERKARRPKFSAGVSVRLANGQLWSLPDRRTDAPDPEYDATFALVLEAEDEAERLRFELALTIFLLSRNYDLTPGDFTALLSFAPHDPALSELQEAVHALVRNRTRAERLNHEHEPQRAALLAHHRSRWLPWFN